MLVKRESFLFVFSQVVLLCFCCLLFCVQVTHATEKGNVSKAIVSSESKLNMRSGPGKNYEVVMQLKPAEVVEVVDSVYVSEGWIRVCSQSGSEGYVSSSYLTVCSESTEGLSDEYGDDLISVPAFASWHVSFYLWLFSLEKTTALLILLGIAIIQALVILWLRRYYMRSMSASAFPAYLLTFVGSLFTIPGLFVYRYTHFREEWGVILCLLMLLSTGCLMLYAAWRVKLCGMYKGIRRLDNSPHYQIGRWMGNILWFLLLIPFAKAWWGFCDPMWGSNVPDVDNSFGSMVVAMSVIGAVNFVIVRWVWPHVLVRFLFQTANQGIVHIMSFILCYGILRFDYNVMDRNFEGIIFFLSLCIFLPVIMMTLAYAWSSVTESRCANCHSFCTEQTGYSDLGYEYRMDTDWKDMDNSKINPRIQGAFVTDAKKKVLTVKKVNKWKTHHTCYNCSNQWEIEREMEVGRSEQVMKKKWTEHY